MKTFTLDTNHLFPPHKPILTNKVKSLHLTKKIIFHLNIFLVFLPLYRKIKQDIFSIQISRTTVLHKTKVQKNGRLKPSPCSQKEVDTNDRQKEENSGIFLFFFFRSSMRNAPNSEWCGRYYSFIYQPLNQSCLFVVVDIINEEDSFTIVIQNSLLTKKQCCQLSEKHASSSYFDLVFELIRVH